MCKVAGLQNCLPLLLLLNGLQHEEDSLETTAYELFMLVHQLTRGGVHTKCMFLI
jgi:hypothetical protein